MVKSRRILDALLDEIERTPMNPVDLTSDYQRLNRLLQSVISIFPGSLSVIDADYNLVYTNLKPRNVGIDHQDLSGDKCFKHCKYIQNSPDECFAKKVFTTGNHVLGKQIQLGNGRWVEVNSIPLKDDFGSILFVVEFISDITQYKETERSLKESEERWQLALEGNNDGIWDWNIRSNEVFFSDRWVEMLGYEHGQLKSIFQTFTMLIHPVDIGKVMKGLQDHMAQKTNHFSMEYRMQCNEGQYKWIHGRAQATWDDSGKAIRMTGSHTDITERKLREEEISFLTFHDKLTGLYNRAYFDDAMRRMDTERMLPLSVIIGDVNGLKVTNDIFGHLVGDQLLSKIAEILQTACRKEDIVARWGGDEFAILLPRTPVLVAEDICQRITNACSNFDDEVIRPNISLGASAKVRMDQKINAVIKEAEDLMYRHKLLESRSNQNVVIASLEKTLFERSNETEEHAQRMKTMGFHLGQVLNLSSSEQDALRLLCVLHDIGKIAITDSILTKNGPLTLDEWHQMKKHPEIGYRIAKSSSKLEHIADYILFHHERWDGTGYPKGLKGKEIPKLSRLLTIIDAYDVMTHERVYKEPRSHGDAVRELKQCAGTQFDPEMVKAFIRIDWPQLLEMTL
ncbi:diguanylate cyclase [Anoxynatronum sibiricum]